MQTSKGFTIIELLVVMVIIIVLTGIILSNINQYITRGKDSAIKGNLSSLVTNGAVYLDKNGDLSSNWCSTTTAPGLNYWGSISAAANRASGGTAICFANTTAPVLTYCACSSLKSGAPDTFCVDSTGYKKQTATACASRCATAVTAVACTD